VADVRDILIDEIVTIATANGASRAAMEHTDMVRFPCFHKSDMKC
jgi:hypothetical protein